MMPTLCDEGLNKLEHIRLNRCHNVSCLVNDGTWCDGDERKTEEKLFKELKHLELWKLDNLKVLWKSPDEYLSLTNLVKFFIYMCNKLERVFMLSVAQGLVNLKELIIQYCSGLKEVIYGGGGGRDDESENIMVFPSLVPLSLFMNYPISKGSSTTQLGIVASNIHL